MKQTIEKIDNVTYKVTQSIKPNGAKGKIDEKGDAYPEVPLTLTFDLTAINPKKVDVPEHIIARALDGWFINARVALKTSLDTSDTESFDSKYKRMKKLIPTWEKDVEHVGIPAERKEGVVKAQLRLEKKRNEDIIHVLEKYADVFDAQKDLVKMKDCALEEWDEFFKKFLAELINRRNK